MSTSLIMALFPILLGAGVAIDYGNAVGARTSILSIADSASISAARILNAEYNRLLAADWDEEKAWLAARRLATREARTLLDGNQILKNDLSYTSTITFGREGSSVKARVEVAATAKPLFMGVPLLKDIFGTDKMQIAVASESEVSLSGTGEKPVYADVYIMLDRSPSMLVGESRQDVDLTLSILKKVKGQSGACAFACHQNDKDKDDPYLRVRADPDVRLKYDVAREAIASFAATANPNYHRIGVYGIGHDWNKAKTPLVPLSNDLTSVAAAIRSIAPEKTCFNCQTEISYSMMQLYNEVLSKSPRSGDGSSDSKRKIFLVLITDGVESIHHGTDWQKQDKGSPKWPWYDDRVTGAPYMMGYWSMSGTRIDRINNSGNRESVCKLIKDKIDIGVLEVEYPDITGLDKEQRYEKLVKDWQGRISGSLKDCASPSLYFKASSTRGAIDSAAKSLFKSVTSTKVAALRLVK